MTDFDQAISRISAILTEERVLRDPLSLKVYARDASLYRIQPQAVLKVENEAEMIAVLQIAHELCVPVGFRAAGTSLSGQALTDGLLLIQGKGWREVEVLDVGRRIRLGPGVRGAEANAHLKPYGRKLGPDPASIDAAKVGGIAANNASGMCCGTQHNSYQTMDSIKIVMADGTLLDTSCPESRRDFSESQAPLLEGIKALAERLHCHPSWVEMVRHKYLIKNTTGYSINAFLDHSDPLDILAHLMIGSEGTLGFISEITYATVPEYAFKSNAMVMFESLQSACLAVQAMSSIDISAIEIMDTKALRSVPKLLSPDVLGEETTALLIEVQDGSSAQMELKKCEIVKVLEPFKVHVDFTENDVQYGLHWKIRKGMFPSVAAMRGKEETVIIEDVAFPLDRLSEGTMAIQALFEAHGYDQAIIFGHAQAGNLHIVFTQAFRDDSDKRHYQILMDELCRLVVDDYGGSLKAEHGTGRNMAPYVKQEWGEELYALMKEIKALMDPMQILNPGVLISEDPELHLKNLKLMPSVAEDIDACMECGFCERACPSKDLSLTPRGRIAAMREMDQLGFDILKSSDERLKREVQYQALDTCATDGMCGEVCPVGINTGSFVKHTRNRQASNFSRLMAKMLAGQLGALETFTSMGLKAWSMLRPLLGDAAFARVMNQLKGADHKGDDVRCGELPQAPKPSELDQLMKENASLSGDEEVVIYATCINRSMGKATGDVSNRDVTAALVSLATKMGVKVRLFKKSGSCCGLPFSSKGFQLTADQKKREALKHLYDISDAGSLEVIVDNSPCTQELLQGEASLRIVDSTQWLSDRLDRLLPRKPLSTLALHTTCSSQKMNIESSQLAIANFVADSVVEPRGVECCGFAGDRGFTHPELNASALVEYTDQVNGRCQSGASSSKTCSLGLQWNSGLPHPHLAQLLDDHSMALNEFVDDTVTS